jgi:hypothetical protein
MDHIQPDLDNIFLNFFKKFANLSPAEEDEWVKYLKEYWLRRCLARAEGIVVCLGVSICLDMVSIEALDLDTSKS